ncbi:hypothetical protein AB0B28_21670 [Glycomyces sp. NPDC046736]|uniref:hypothetical protein n=1 Tax=Glycomyces sp. NPDC046736 TaxID=3155615 RepID=UPI0033E4158B
MTFPPPPPDRLHLQYQPVPPPQPQPSPQMGPGGAYGPMQPTGQPLPGQGPIPELNAKKPGTITGIQVILWIFTALAALGDLFSAISLVNYFHPLSLVALAFAVYSTIQSLASGVHITRGKRWAWIWTLISSIIGIVLGAAAIIFGTFDIENTWPTLLIGIALTSLYTVLLCLLCSKSARQWILMHRIQRGEVQLPGAQAGGMIGTAPQGPAERPATRPGSATFALVVIGAIMALTAWSLYGAIQSMIAMNQAGMSPLDLRTPMMGAPYSLFITVAGALLLVCALITGLGLLKGKFGPRVFAYVWTPIILLLWAFAMIPLVDFYLVFRDFGPGAAPQLTMMLIRECVIFALIIVVFIAALLPGVRAWTPGKPKAPLVMMVPMGQQPPQQGYQQQQPPQQGYPQQQQQYPPRY